MKLIGFQTASGQSKDGKAYSGYRFHFSRPLNADQGEGEAVENVYISEQYVDEIPKLGDDLEVLYNKYGRPVGLMPAK